MELNEEVVKKAMDWIDSLVGNSNDSDIAMFTYQLLGILYDTCKELTEDNEYLKTQVTATEARYESRKESDLEEVLELRLKVEELTEENKVRKGLNTMLNNELRRLGEENERLERICHSYALQYGTATDKEVFLKKERAETAKKLKSMIMEECIKGGIFPMFMKNAIDRASKKLLEEE